MSEFEYNSPMFMQTVYLAVKDGVTDAIQHMQATGFIEEIAGQFKGDEPTLATRLAAVEAERDALREGLGGWLKWGQSLYHVEQYDRAELQRRLADTIALLGKETPDGQ